MQHAPRFGEFETLALGDVRAFYAWFDLLELTLPNCSPRWGRQLDSLSQPLSDLEHFALKISGSRFRRSRFKSCPDSIFATTPLGTAHLSIIRPQEIAQQCALLCCVQRKLGYFAALHEGAVGSGSIVNRSPPLPLALRGGVGEATTPSAERLAVRPISLLRLAPSEILGLSVSGIFQSLSVEIGRRRGRNTR